MEDNHRSKGQLYQLFARLASALANPHRLELLDLLVQAPRTVEDLSRQAHMSVANTSQHLQRLKLAHLVEDERHGLFIRYRLADPAVARLWLELRRVAGLQLADVERALNAYRPRRHEFDRISVDELLERLARDEVVLIDVRPEVEFQAGHLPGAVSIPLDDLEKHLEGLPSGKLIVAYCRGPYCVLADQALELLSSKGWAVARLEEGVAELTQAGFCVIGTDFAAGMLAKAQDKITNGLSRLVSFQQADLNMPLKFHEARFDHIIGISVLQAVANPIFTLSELHRVLKPGGTLVLSLPKQNSILFSQSVGEFVRYRIRHLERRTPGKILLVILKSFGDRFGNIPRWTMLQAQQMTSASGFKVISLDEGGQILVVAEKVAV